MSDDTPSPLNSLITIDDERIKSHLDRVVRGTVEETLNALLDAEADRLCNPQRYERSEARRVGTPAPDTTSAAFPHCWVWIISQCQSRGFFAVCPGTPFLTRPRRAR